MGRLALTILAHVAVFVGVDLQFTYVVVVPGDTDGLGTGFVAFATMAILATAWGCLDGWLHSPLAVTGIWLTTAVGSGLEMALAIQLPPGTVDWSVLGDDLLTFAPFAVALVGVPGLVAGLLVATLRPARTPAR